MPDAHLLQRGCCKMRGCWIQDARWRGTLLSKQTKQDLGGDSGILVLQQRASAMWRAPVMLSVSLPASVLIVPASPLEWWGHTCPRYPLRPSAASSDSCAHTQLHSPRKSELSGPLSSSQASSSKKCLFSPNCPDCCVQLNEPFEL